MPPAAEAGNVDSSLTKGNPIYTKIRDDNPTRYLEGSKVKNSLLADGCVVEGTVENSVLFRGCQIKEGCFYLMRNYCADTGYRCGGEQLR